MVENDLRLERFRDSKISNIPTRVSPVILTEQVNIYTAINARSDFNRKTLATLYMHLDMYIGPYALHVSYYFIPLDFCSQSCDQFNDFYGCPGLYLQFWNPRSTQKMLKVLKRILFDEKTKKIRKNLGVMKTESGTVNIFKEISPNIMIIFKFYKN